MKVQLDIEIPEGYEVAEGEQPRLPVQHDHYMSMGGDSVGLAGYGFDFAKCIILKKIEPEYDIYIETRGGGEGVQYKYVSINALEHALFVMGKFMLDLSAKDIATYDKLKDLIK